MNAFISALIAEAYEAEVGRGGRDIFYSVQPTVLALVTQAVPTVRDLGLLICRVNSSDFSIQ